ncbi:MAG: DUF2149 domain-containing protein [Rectinemataceae bacterium]|nr:DUF2149 domain-containing protein [Rectinemataceae bacterium]
MRKRRFHRDDELVDNDQTDPMSGVANLFDLGVVFIVALLVALVSTYRLQELFNENSETTIVKKNQNGEMEIITKKGRKVNVVKMTKEKSEGRGERLGTAYRLEDGSTVYVPE